MALGVVCCCDLGGGFVFLVGLLSDWFVDGVWDWLVSVRKDLF